MNHNVRFITCNQERTGMPDGARVNYCLKVGKDKGDKPRYVWIPSHTEADTDYKAIDIDAVRIGDVIPTIDKIYDDAQSAGLIELTAPQNLLEPLLDGDVAPSVTTVLSFFAKDIGLERWKKMQMLDHVYELMDGEYPDKETWKSIAQIALNYKNEEAAERGTRWHSAIEEAMDYREVTSLLEHEYAPFRKAWKTIESFCSNHSNKVLERSVVFEDEYGNKYGGTIDYRAGDIVLDWKTTEKDVLNIYKSKPSTMKQAIVRPEHAVQLAGYAKALRIPQPRLINGYINVTNGDVALYEYNSHEPAELIWDNMVALWYSKLQNDVKSGKLIAL